MPASNNVFQKNANTSLVAQLIWRQGGLSRVDISRLLQLNKSTVSNIISYLMEIGLVSEGERKDATSLEGRKPRPGQTRWNMQLPATSILSCA